MADITYPVAGGAHKRLVDMNDGTHAEAVAIVGLGGDVEITGDANIDTAAVEAGIGAPADAAWDGDPGEASLVAILKALHAQNVAIIALLTTIADNTGGDV